MKKIFFSLLLSLMTLSACADVDFLTQPYLQSLTPTSVTIMWVTSGNSQVTGWVKYGVDACDTEAFEIDRGLKQAFTKIYRVHIDNLTPGTTYQYKALIREITGFVGNTSLTWGDTKESGVFTFTTPLVNQDSISCLIFNDIHSHPEFIQPLLSNNNLSFGEQDFVVFNGDILNAVPNESKIVSNLLQPATANFASEKPFFFVRGNHEYRNKYARNLLNYIETGEQNLGYYSFQYGPAFFIFLDTGEDKEDTHQEYNGLLACEAYRRIQAQWLQEQMTSEVYQNAKYRIVFMHIPMWSNTKTARFAVTDCRELFLDIMNTYKPDVVISGHTHKAGVLEANEEHCFPIFIGGGKDTSEEKRTYCPSIMQLKVSNTELMLDLMNYYGENIGNLNLKK